MTNMRIAGKGARNARILVCTLLVFITLWYLFLARGSPASYSNNEGVDIYSQQSAPISTAEIVGGDDRQTASGRQAQTISENRAPLYGKISVTVCNEATNIPIAGLLVKSAYVEVLEAARQVGGLADRGPWRSEALTTESGSADLIVHPGHIIALTLHNKQGDKLGEQQQVPALHSGEHRTLIWRVPSHAQYRAQIVDAKTGLAVVNARATANVPQSKGQPFSGIICENGLLVVPIDVGVQSQSVTIEATGYSPITIIATRGQDSAGYAALIRLSRSASLSLAFNARGTALNAEAIVSIASMWTQIHVHGRESIYPQNGQEKLHWTGQVNMIEKTTINDLPTQVPLVIRVTPESATPCSQPGAVTLEPGETRDLVLELCPPIALNGQVLSPPGRPVSNLTLWAMPATRQGDTYFTRVGASAARTATTDGTGHFLIEGLSDGQWWIGPRPTPSSVIRGESAIAPLAHWIKIESTSQPAFLTIKLEPSAYLFARVTVNGEVRHIGAFINARHVQSGAVMAGRSKADGVLTLGPLVQGVYSVSAHANGYFAEPQLLMLGAARGEITLDLILGSSVRGIVVDGHNNPLPFSLVHYGLVDAGRAWNSTVADGDGRFEIRGLRAGVYSVVAANGDSLVGMEVFSCSGEAADRVLVVSTTRQSGTLLVRYTGSASVAIITAFASDVFAGGCVVLPGVLTPFIVPSGEILLRVELPELQSVLTKKLDGPLGHRVHIHVNDAGVVQVP